MPAPDRMAFSALYYDCFIYFFPAQHLLQIFISGSESVKSEELRNSYLSLKEATSPFLYYLGWRTQKVFSFHPVFSVLNSHLLEHVDISRRFRNTSLVQFRVI